MDDRNLETLLAQHFGSRLAIRKKVRHVYGKDGQFDTVDDGIEVNIDFLGGSEGDFLVALEYLNKPADPIFISGQFARLRAALPRSAESNQDIELLIDVMVDDCSGYPKDVIAHVAKNWRLTHKFFPSPSEFRSELERAVDLRRSLLTAFSVARHAKIEAPKPKEPEIDFKDKPREKWTSDDWDKYVGEADGMIKLSEECSIINGEEWKTEKAMREALRPVDREPKTC